MNHEYVQLEFEVNEQTHRLMIPANTTLIEVLRDQLGMTGTKQGCGLGQCGACTVLLNRRPVNACCLLALQAHGQKISTIEGLTQQGGLDPIQESFVSEHAVQCGFCTPGMIMSSKALLRYSPRPQPGEIREALSGNICRCTGYTKIIRAVQRAADKLESTSQ